MARMVAPSEKLAEVLRVLDRYLVEVIEAYGLCPWARQARLGGELSVAVLWGQPELAEWQAAAQELLARPTTRVAMVVAPELAETTGGLRGTREQISRIVKIAGVAEFHPDGNRDTATAARLVSHLRRSPDPLLQFVPFEILESVRSSPALTDLQEQAKALGGISTAPREDIGDRIAETNHARVVKDLAAFDATLDDIAADRRRSYARVGISINTSR
jgi:hypothetical protein